MLGALDQQVQTRARRRGGGATLRSDRRDAAHGATAEMPRRRAMDDAGMDTSGSPRRSRGSAYGMEARSSTVVSALMARETERLTIGWGIISPFTRHPVQVAMDARVVQEAAGPGRFILGFGTSKIFLNNAQMQTKKTLGQMRDAVEIVRGVLGGEGFEYEGDTWSASVPALSAEAHAPREVPPVYIAATAPKMMGLAAELADGCLTPSITTPAFVRHTRELVGPDIDVGCTVVASIDEDRDQGRDGAREIAGMYLANKVPNIQGAADTLLDLAGLESRTRSGRARRWSRRRLAAKARHRGFTRASRSRGRRPTAPPRSREYRDAQAAPMSGASKLWGDKRHDQIHPSSRPPRATLPFRDRSRPSRAAEALAAVSIRSFTGSGAMATGGGPPSARSRAAVRKKVEGRAGNVQRRPGASAGGGSRADVQQAWTPRTPAASRGWPGSQAAPQVRTRRPHLWPRDLNMKGALVPISAVRAGDAPLKVT